MTNCGTQLLSLEASAARPDVGCGSRLRLEGEYLGRGYGRDLALFTGSPIPSTPANRPWMQVKWDVKPVSTVATTDHHIPRPLERSP
jgi:hypothetical protein